MESEFELRTTRGRERPACPGSAPGDAALGRGPRFRCISAGAGQVRRVLLLLLLLPPPDRFSSAVPRRPGPFPAIPRHPHLPALSALSAPLSCVVVEEPVVSPLRGSLGAWSAPPPPSGETEARGGGTGRAGGGQPGCRGPIPRPQPVRGEDSASLRPSSGSGDARAECRGAGCAATCVPRPEGRRGPRDFHAHTHPRLRALSPPEPFIRCLRSDLRSVNPFSRPLSLTESVKTPVVQGSCLRFHSGVLAGPQRGSV